jgi:hypothetical protein
VSLAHVVSTSGLDDGGLEGSGVEVLAARGEGLDGELSDNLLDVGLVDGHLGLLHDTGVVTSPGKEDELSTLALLITGHDTSITESDFGVIAELLGELLETTSTSGTYGDSVTVSIDELGPAQWKKKQERWSAKRMPQCPKW